MANPAPRLPRVRATKRSAAPSKTTTGPRVGAVVENGKVVVRVLDEGEYVAPRLQAPAEDTTVEALQKALAMIAKRVQGATLPVVVIA